MEAVLQQKHGVAASYPKARPITAQQSKDDAVASTDYTYADGDQLFHADAGANAASYRAVALPSSLEAASTSIARGHHPPPPPNLELLALHGALAHGASSPSAGGVSSALHVAMLAEKVVYYVLYAGFVAVVVCPLALLYARQVLRRRAAHKATPVSTCEDHDVDERVPSCDDNDDDSFRDEESTAQHAARPSGTRPATGSVSGSETASHSVVAELD